jgi:hypothetical protein
LFLSSPALVPRVSSNSYDFSHVCPTIRPFTPVFSYIFGLSSSVAGHITYVDDTDVVYPAGHAIVRLDTDTKVQRLIQGGVNSKGVCALATAGNRRYTAFAEAMLDKHPVITVYDWPNKRRRKVINNVDMGSTTVLCMNFSPDTKYLVVQAGAPEFNLFVLHWEKGKVVGRLSAVGTMVCRPCVHVSPPL